MTIAQRKRILLTHNVTYKMQGDLLMAVCVSLDSIGTRKFEWVDVTNINLYTWLGY